MANMTFKANLLPNSDLEYSLGSSNKRWKINDISGGAIEYIESAQIINTSSWVGYTKDSSIQPGKVIAYKLGQESGISNVTLTLWYDPVPTSGATGTNAIPVYLNNTRVSNQYPQGSVILMTYDGSSWRITDVDTNTDTKVTQNASLTTANGYYPMLLAYSTSTSAITNVVNKTNSLKFNPSQYEIAFSNTAETFRIYPNTLTGQLNDSSSQEYESYIKFMDSNQNEELYQMKLQFTDSTTAASPYSTVALNGSYATLETATLDSNLPGSYFCAYTDKAKIGLNDGTGPTITVNPTNVLIESNDGPFIEVNNGEIGLDNGDASIYLENNNITISGDSAQIYLENDEVTMGEKLTVKSSSVDRHSRLVLGSTSPYVGRGELVLFSKENVRTNIYSNLTTAVASTTGYNNFYFPNQAGDSYLVHVGRSTAVGSSTWPVFIADNGRATAISGLSPFTIDLGSTTYNTGEYGDALSVKFNNANNLSHTIKAIRIVGNNATDNYNGTLVVGSNTGQTIVGSGESLDTFATEAEIQNGESLLFTSDATISFYPGLSNSSTNYSTQRMGYFYNGGFNVGNYTISTTEIGSRVYGSAGVIGIYTGGSSGGSMYLWAKPTSQTNGKTLSLISKDNIVTHYGQLEDFREALHPIIRSYYNGTAYENMKNHNNGNITLDANSGKLFLGYQSTTSLYFMNGRAIMDTSGTFNLLNTSDASGSTTAACALVIGSITGEHIEMDTNEILAKSSATTASTLFLQDTNGTVQVCGTGGLTVSAGHVNITGSNKHLYIENGKLVVGASSIYTQRTGQSTTTSFGMFVNSDAYVNSTFNTDHLRIWAASSASRIPAAWYNNDILYGYFRFLVGNSTSKGYSQLWLGNNRPDGTANAACGQIILYGTSTGYTSIYGSTTALGGTTRTYVSMAYVAGTQIWGAVYNDYAEFRETKEEIKPGYCVTECGDGSLKLSTERLMRGGEIVSDTYGFAIGATDTAKTPIAASGRVLAYCYEGQEYAKEHIGWPVGTGPDGTVSIMSEEEERLYPSRIIGIISEVPTYEIWQKGSDEDPEYVNVNGRIWIRIR